MNPRYDSYVNKVMMTEIRIDKNFNRVLHDSVFIMKFNDELGWGQPRSHQYLGDCVT